MAYPRYLLLLAVLLALGACTAKPLNAKRAALRVITPNMVVAQPVEHRGKQVEWGGVLIRAHNRQESTLLELLAYPLDSEGRPRPNTQPMGRFLAVQAGYLETVEYAPGRLVTVVGPITGTRQGRIEEATYLYPTVEAQQLRLWPRDSARSEPQVYFGIGVGVGF